MGYVDHFRLADDYIAHTNVIVNNIADPFIKQRYVGFITISAVTVYELAVKELLIDFAKKKHKVFGTVIENLYDKINGRIALRELKDTHIRRFGKKYIDRFHVKLELKENEFLKLYGRSIKSSYGNIITWRNAFVHEGHVPINASYSESIRAYEDGKEVIHALSGSMVR